MGNTKYVHEVLCKESLAHNCPFMQVCPTHPMSMLNRWPPKWWVVPGRYYTNSLIVTSQWLVILDTKNIFTDFFYKKCTDEFFHKVKNLVLNKYICKQKTNMVYFLFYFLKCFSSFNDKQHACVPTHIFYHYQVCETRGHN